MQGLWRTLAAIILLGLLPSCALSRGEMPDTPIVHMAWAAQHFHDALGDVHRAKAKLRDALARLGYDEDATNQCAAAVLPDGRLMLEYEASLVRALAAVFRMQRLARLGVEVPSHVGDMQKRRAALRGQLASLDRLRSALRRCQIEARGRGEARHHTRLAFSFQA